MAHSFWFSMQVGLVLGWSRTAVGIVRLHRYKQECGDGEKKFLLAAAGAETSQRSVGTSF